MDTKLEARPRELIDPVNTNEAADRIEWRYDLEWKGGNAPWRRASR